MKYNVLKPVILIFAAFAAAYIASTRVIFSDPSDDLFRYYETFGLASATSFFDFIFWPNREPLFQLYNWTLFAIFGSVDPRIYLQLVILPGFVAYVYCLSKISGHLRYGWLVYLSLFLPPILLYNTQLIRQAISFYFIFAAIFSSRLNVKALLCFVAVGFHYIAIPVFLLYITLCNLVLKRGFKVRFCFFMVLGSLIVFFPYVFDYIILIFSQFDTFSVKVAFLRSIDISVVLNPIGVFCFFVTVVYVLFFYPSDVFLKKLYSIVLMVFVFSSLGLYYEVVSQRFSVFLFSFLIPCLICILSPFFKRKNSWIIIGLTCIVFLSITIKYLITPSYFSLFNGYFSQ